MPSQLPMRTPAASELAATLSLLAIAACAASPDLEPAELDAIALERNQPEASARFDEAIRSRPQEARIVVLHDRASEALRALIAEPDAYWALLTDPETSFVDRAAAAYQGGSYHSSCSQMKAPDGAGDCSELDRRVPAVVRGTSA